MRVVASQKLPRDSVDTEQMDAKGLAHKLLLTASGDPCRTPEKQTVGTVSASQKCQPCKHFRALSMPALQRGAAWVKDLGALRQSVPHYRQWRDKSRHRI